MLMSIGKMWTLLYHHEKDHIHAPMFKCFFKFILFECRYLEPVSYNVLIILYEKYGWFKPEMYVMHMLKHKETI